MGKDFVIDAQSTCCRRVEKDYFGTWIFARILTDNGREYAGKAVSKWSYFHWVTSSYSIANRAPIVTVRV